MPTLNQLSATEIAHGIAAGKFTAEAVVRDCLDRVAAREPVVHAWATIDPDHALKQARTLDRGPRKGALHGVPLGIKDVIDTVDLPTEMGSEIYKGNRAACDAACVAVARAAGAVILGKTVTAEFAGMFPGPTTNPHNPAHTPGGSSSGSAAAVADHMVPAAFGTQTGGSVLRPAAFCGVVGYKPTFNLINRSGIKFAAESLDTIGLIARTIDDVELVTAAVVGKEPARRTLSSPPRLGLCRTPLWDTAQPETKQRSRTPPSACPLPAPRCATSRCRRNSPACSTPRARPSTITSARNRWRPTGPPTARTSARCSATASRPGWRCGTTTTSRRCGSRKIAAPGSMRPTRGSTP